MLSGAGASEAQIPRSRSIPTLSAAVSGIGILRNKTAQNDKARRPLKAVPPSGVMLRRQGCKNIVATCKLIPMPELPDIAAYISALEPRIVGQPIQQVRLASPFLLRTAQPPVSSVEGRMVRELRRIGSESRLVWKAICGWCCT